jgi:hypothetical protein
MHAMTRYSEFVEAFGTFKISRVKFYGTRVNVILLISVRKLRPILSADFHETQRSSWVLCVVELNRICPQNRAKYVESMN